MKKLDPLHYAPINLSLSKPNSSSTEWLIADLSQGNVHPFLIGPDFGSFFSSREAAERYINAMCK